MANPVSSDSFSDSEIRMIRKTKDNPALDQEWRRRNRAVNNPVDQKIVGVVTRPRSSSTEEVSDDDDSPNLFYFKN